MDTRPRVALAGLSTGFTTRTRGEEAYKKLLPELIKGTVVLDLDGTDVLSTSFLDGLLLQLIKDDHLGNVMFATSNPLTQIRLERLSGTRSVDIQIMNSKGVVRRARKRAYFGVKPKFATTKGRSAATTTTE